MQSIWAFAQFLHGSFRSHLTFLLWHTTQENGLAGFVFGAVEAAWSLGRAMAGK